MSQRTDAKKPSGIACPKCGSLHLWKIRDTDKLPGAVRRYRKCRNCGHVKKTTER